MHFNDSSASGENEKVKTLGAHNEDSTEQFLTTNHGVKINDDQNSLKAGEPAEVGVFNSKTGSRELTLNGHSRDVIGLAYSSDGKLIATASSDKTCKIWKSKFLELQGLGWDFLASHGRSPGFESRAAHCKMQM